VPRNSLASCPQSADAEHHVGLHVRRVERGPNDGNTRVPSGLAEVAGELGITIDNEEALAAKGAVDGGARRVRPCLSDRSPIEFRTGRGSSSGNADDDRVVIARHTAGLVSLACSALVPGCGENARDPGPAPAGDYQQRVSVLQDEIFGKRYRLAEPSSYRFAAPARGRVARWHWEPQGEGRTHSFGYRHGWCVEFWVRPRYSEYPEQPESRRMAFFAAGELRGIFNEGGGSAPLDLDRWSAEWVGPDWEPAIASTPAK
jgi:hypothetical protein